MMVTIGVGVVFLSATAPAVGQEGQGAESRPVSRPWPPARMADGQPDVQGIWAAAPGGSVSLSNPISGGADLERRISGRELRVPSRIIDPPDGLVPYQPWAAALQKQQESVYDRPTRPEHIDPQHRCLLSGVPRLYTSVPPHRIIQLPGAVLIIWDEYHAYRYIPLDNRPPVASYVKLWMGHSRGRWEGNTLVIDTTNIRGTRLSFTGDFLSDNAHLIERLTFVDADTMNYEATIEDPTVFTRPWTMRVAHKRRPYEEAWESACMEGNMPPDTWLLKDEPPRQ
ncbi:MAG: hypothetical protein A3I61_16780 [Acidobacteria bacterium RIFCSPLOWO2_02_FULL_68_18]|nr:MAG: hypothetical protein A3I61_16780 [Acidobacteria bacterium RIFCSPLOWO2_02_FULL_68_18]OFW50112.1 MAG: hypothetical protein A3G77_09160 [Acidobacteria bacterium RIFCSPLOWO2_12_FULL_68_19]